MQGNGYALTLLGRLYMCPNYLLPTLEINVAATIGPMPGIVFK